MWILRAKVVNPLGDLPLFTIPRAWNFPFITEKYYGPGEMQKRICHPFSFLGLKVGQNHPGKFWVF
jgi:hypothetical protein